jgi:Cysteine-rich secretory protein family
VNATRVSHGLRPLHPAPTLERAAQAHSTDMLQHNYFAHGDFGGRMSAFQVPGPAVGENIAWGAGRYARAGSIVREWLESPEHRANLLRPGYSRIGIGVARGSFLGAGSADRRDRGLKPYSISISERSSASFSPRSSSRSPRSIRSSNSRTSGASSSGLNGFVT